MIHKNCSCKKRPSSRWHVHPNTRSVTRGNIFLLCFLICPYVVHTFQVCIAMLAARHPKSTIGNVPALGHLVHWVHCPHRACSDHGEFVRMSCARWVPTPGHYGLTRVGCTFLGHIHRSKIIMGAGGQQQVRIWFELPINRVVVPIFSTKKENKLQPTRTADLLNSLSKEASGWQQVIFLFCT